MEIGFELDNFSLEKYKKILENSSQILTEFQEKRLVEEIEYMEKEIIRNKNRLSIMKNLLACNECKKKENLENKVKKYQDS